MEGPFFPGFWSSRPARPGAVTPAMAKPSPPAKVVSIPVHFINSDKKVKEQLHSTATTDATVAAAGGSSKRITTTAAALQIQRVVRGFLVRKNLMSVRRLEAEVDAVAREVERAGERLRRDARERLRVSESLMSLLFRLDSVRGVRDYRRRVIRRAIALQEAVDAVAAGEESVEGAAPPTNGTAERLKGNAPDEPLEEQAPTPMEISRSAESNPEAQEDHGEAPDSREDDGGKKIDEEDSVGDGIAEELKQEEGEGTTASEIPTKEALDMGEASEDQDGEQMGDVIRASVRTGESSAHAPAMAEGEASQGCGEGMRQAMDRMVEENIGLKGLVAELCERNEMQLCLMEGLLQRVERLEKVVEKTGRKRQKRRQAADAKKCCARKCERRLSCDD